MVFSLTVLLRRRVDLGDCGTPIGAIYSFQVAKIGSVRELTSRARPAFESIKLASQALNVSPSITFSGKSLTKPKKILVCMLARST